MAAWDPGGFWIESASRATFWKNIFTGAGDPGMGVRIFSSCTANFTQPGELNPVAYGI